MVRFTSAVAGLVLVAALLRGDDKAPSLDGLYTPSAMMKDGFSASALATPIRCRCPPLNSCG